MEDMELKDVSMENISEENENDHEGKVQCDHCGEWLDECDLYDVMGDMICDDCKQEMLDNGDIYYCDECGDYACGDDFIWMENLGIGVCQSCFDNHYTECCVCGEYMTQNNSYSNDNGDSYCEQCYYDRYTTCDACDCEIHRDDACYDDYGTYCEECYEERHSDGIIEDYHTSKDNDDYEFFMTDKEKAMGKEPLYFGFELEVDSNKDVCRRNVAEGVNNIINKNQRLVTFENDGSLSDNGFEIISQPMTLAFLKENKNLLGEAFMFLMNNGYTSHDNGDCGLHIHFSRSYFKDNGEELGDKLVLLSEIFKSELEAFCRRQKNGYAKFLSDNQYNNEMNMKKMSDVKKTHKDRDRYQVFNFTNNNTIEFRLPKGTLRLETFIATIEFINNFVYFANKKEANLLCLTWEDIVSYKKNDNPSLVQYCTHRRLLKSDTIVNFGAIDTLKPTKRIMDSVMKKAQRKGARMDITMGTGNINIAPLEYANEGAN